MGVRSCQKAWLLLAFLHETNTFAASPATLAAFVQGGGCIPLLRGGAIFENAQNVNLGIAGALKFAQEASWEVVPILGSAAIPSAPVTKEAYETIVSEIVTEPKNCGPIDGIFIDLRGAMVAEHIDDGEGELLERVRAVGPSEPLSVDFHGSITKRTFEHADVMVGFRTYPHIDIAETGYRAAEALQGLMDKLDGWHKAVLQGDYLIPIAWPSRAAKILPIFLNVCPVLTSMSCMAAKPRCIILPSFLNRRRCPSARRSIPGSLKPDCP